MLYNHKVFLYSWLFCNYGDIVLFGQKSFILHSTRRQFCRAQVKASSCAILIKRLWSICAIFQSARVARGLSKKFPSASAKSSSFDQICLCCGDDGEKVHGRCARESICSFCVTKRYAAGRHPPKKELRVIHGDGINMRERLTVAAHTQYMCPSKLFMNCQGIVISQLKKVD